MADSQGLSPGDTGYDATSDPYSPTYGGGNGTPAGGPSGTTDWWEQNQPNQGGVDAQLSANLAGATAEALAAQNAPGGGKGTGNAQQDWNAFLQANPQYTGAYLRTNMPAAVAAFNQQYGYSAKAGTPNASGEIDVVDFGSGIGPIDLIHGGDNALQWIPDSGSSSGGDLIAPFIGSAPTPRTTAPFAYPSFSAPSGQDVLTSDPGYGFRLSQGEQALQGSAAARGTLNTGGTLKDILNYGQSAASQEYSDAFNRALGIYTTNRNNAFGNAQQNFTQDTTANNYDFNKYLNDQNVFWTNQGNAYNRLAGQQAVGLQAASAS